jgi:hypothetical protein
MESNPATRRGTHAFTAREALQCSASARKEGRPAGFEPEPRGSRPRMLAVTPRPPCADAGLAGVGRSTSVSTEIERREITMAREAGRIFRRRAGTTGLEPARARLTSECSQPLSYVPVSSAGGIRTHGLELMRLARTASPLPRKSGRQESNLRSPAPKAGGVANSPTGSSQSTLPMPASPASASQR